MPSQAASSARNRSVIVVAFGATVNRPRLDSTHTTPARRAILRCALQQDGYRLPAGKYARWREIIIEFRPQGGARIR